MPTDAAKRVNKSTSGPAGTASQRASKKGSTSGRKSTAGSKVEKGNKLPERQGT